MTESVPEIAIHGLTPKTLPSFFETREPADVAFARACGFKGEPGQVHFMRGADGAIAGVLFGVDDTAGGKGDRFCAGKLVAALPEGMYRLAEGFPDPMLAALAFALASYRFTRARKALSPLPRLATPPGVDAARVALISSAICMGRDLINRPANDMTPNALEAAAVDLAAAHGATIEVTRHDDLAREFPMVHAVGRAAAEAPRLVDMRWGDPSAPKVTLVGKGVCFDTGGLDIKPSAGMLLMKKDMGGAAVALALAAMVMGAGLRVRLRVVLPIVENAIAGDAFRPGDILTSRKGLTVEVGNTDAEGRLILADALALADVEEPELLFDFATLTGAARVALGPDLPPFYTDDDTLASDIATHALAVNDPGWRMPLWDPYDATLKSKVADMCNISSGPFAGSITAALFLRRFVERTRSWVHFDVYGWTPSAKPGRPEGGEIQMARALFDLLSTRYSGE